MDHLPPEPAAPGPGARGRAINPAGVLCHPGVIASARLIRTEADYEHEIEVHARDAKGVWHEVAKSRQLWCDRPFVRPARGEVTPLVFMGLPTSYDCSPGSVICVAGQLDRDAARLAVETEHGSYEIPVAPETGAFVIALRLGASGEHLMTVWDHDGSVAAVLGDAPWRYREARVIAHTATVKLVPPNQAGTYGFDDADRATGTLVWCHTSLRLGWPDGTEREMGGSRSSPVLFGPHAVLSDVTDVGGEPIIDALAEDEDYLLRMGVRSPIDERPAVRVVVDPALAAAMPPDTGEA